MKTASIHNLRQTVGQCALFRRNDTGKEINIGWVEEEMERCVRGTIGSFVMRLPRFDYFSRQFNKFEKVKVGSFS